MSSSSSSSSNTSLKTLAAVGAAVAATLAVFVSGRKRDRSEQRAKVAEAAKETQKAAAAEAEEKDARVLKYPLYEDQGLSTRAIHAGYAPDPSTGAVVPPMSLATTYAQASPGDFKGYEYSRTGNPMRHTFEACIASLEKCKHGLAFSSGSAACATIIHMLDAGDHVVVIDDVYGGSQRYFRRIATAANNLSFSFEALAADPENLTRAIKKNTKLVWMETPTNPTLQVADIQAVANICKKNGITLVVDNTFLSPALQNPIDFGADIVVHSVSKWINGHSDVIMGVVTTNSQEIRDKLAFLQNGIGATPSAFDCYMAHRGVKTLALRMQRHCENAQRVAEYLEAHPKIERVIYPGLPSHPQYELCQRQMKGPGGMITAYIAGGLKGSSDFLSSLKIWTLAESLGAVECLAEHPAIMTHASVPKEQREKLGIDDNMVRLSVGVENVEDIINDIKQALDKVQA